LRNVGFGFNPGRSGLGRNLMAGRPYVLADTNWKTVRETEYQVAILPWGATEAHNFHLPYGTDTVQAQAVAVESARLAWEAGSRCLVLPPVPFGSNAQQVDIPHTLNLNPTTQAFVLSDIVESLDAQGLSKLVVLNGHGGNDFRPMIREIQARTEVFLCALDWYKLPEVAEHFDNPGDHAGEMETSLMLHLASELVLPPKDAGPGEARTFKVQGLREGWAWAPRNWIQVTKDTGVGDPSGASAVKGEGFFEALTQRIGGFLVDLAQADLEDLYE
jgi:creatinine amidohydrolase